MKNFTRLFSVSFFTIISVANIQAQDGVLIDYLGITRDASAVLDVRSASQGVLVPRFDIIDLSTAAPVTAPATGLLVYNTYALSGVGYYYWNGTRWTRFVDNSTGSNFVTGTGTQNYVTKWNNAAGTTIGNSLIFDNGTNVGVGTPSPIGQLQIKGLADFDGSTRLYVTNNNLDYGRTNLILTGRLQAGNDAWNFGSNGRNSIVFATNSATSGASVGAVGTEYYSIQLEGNSKSLGFLSTTNGNTPVMTMLQDGNVGLGSSGPSSKLEVRADGTGVGWAGRLALSNSTGDNQVFLGTYNSRSVIASHNYALNAWQDLFVNTIDGTTGGAAVIMQGPLGVGTGSPSILIDAKLNQIIGSSATSVGQHDVSNRGTKVSFGSTSGDFAGMRVLVGAGTNGCGNTGDIRFDTWECNTSVSREVMRINGRGRVGIGTTSPLAPLDVNGSVSLSTANTSHTGPTTGVNYAGFTYVATNGGGNIGYSGSDQSYAISIRASNSMLAQGYFATSDARIKNIIGSSNSEQDLLALRQINVTNYTMRDEVQNGKSVIKKVIAQELQEVYPIAVKTSPLPQFIPNIYQLATGFSIEDRSVTITLSKAISETKDIKTGSRCAFYLNEKDGTQKEMKGILELTTGNKIIVKTNEPMESEKYEDRLFVYGTEINDILTVDYEAISMLNVSATQELAKRLQAAQYEIETFKNENGLLRLELRSLSETYTKIFDGLKAEVDALKQIMTIYGKN